MSESIQQFNESMQQLNRDKDQQSQIDHIHDVDFDNISQISSQDVRGMSELSVGGGRAGALFNKVASGVNAMFQENAQ